MRILVVEDDWHVAGALKRAFETEGMEVIGPVATTADARRLAATNKPELAIVDTNLKGEMAYDVIDELNGQGVHVVVISDYPPCYDWQRSLQPVKEPECSVD